MTQTQTNDIYPPPPMLANEMETKHENVNYSYFFAGIITVWLVCVCDVFEYNNNLREFVCVWRKSATQHTAIRLRLGNGKTFFPHTRWPTYIFTHLIGNGYNHLTHFTTARI